MDPAETTEARAAIAKRDWTGICMVNILFFYKSNKERKEQLMKGYYFLSTIFDLVFIGFTLTVLIQYLDLQVPPLQNDDWKVNFF
jgi:hypothetical protein